MLGKEGIFISDVGREQLKITLSQEEFDRLKQHINDNQDPEQLHKCYLTNQYYKAKDGLFLSPQWMADAIEQSIQSQEKLHEQFKKDGVVVCSKCGTRNTATSKITNCENCNQQINTKKYEKSIKLGFTKKKTLQLYAKYLRGGIKT